MVSARVVLVTIINVFTALIATLWLNFFFFLIMQKDREREKRGVKQSCVSRKSIAAREISSLVIGIHQPHTHTQTESSPSLGADGFP